MLKRQVLLSVMLAGLIGVAFADDPAPPPTVIPPSDSASGGINKPANKTDADTNLGDCTGWLASSPATMGGGDTKGYDKWSDYMETVSPQCPNGYTVVQIAQDFSLQAQYVSTIEGHDFLRGFQMITKVKCCRIVINR